MKRSRLSYDEWKCIISKDIFGKTVNSELLNGYIGLIDIKAVSKIQTWEFNGEDIVVCDKGRKWLSILPQNDWYCITAMMDENEKILLWYIDMIAKQGIDVDGVPYFDDLYLDLILFSDGRIMEDDREELEEARSEGDITEEQYHLALQTCERLKQNLSGRETEVRRYTKRCYDWLKKQRRAEASIEGSGSFC